MDRFMDRRKVMRIKQIRLRTSSATNGRFMFREHDGGGPLKSLPFLREVASLYHGFPLSF